MSREHLLWIAFTLLGAFGAWSFLTFGRKLADKHGSDIRIVFYLFSLGAVVTLLVALWGAAMGAVDAHGDFHGQLGSVLKGMQAFSTDVLGEFCFLAGLVALITVPQLATYLLSAPFQVATSPRYVGFASRTFIWGMVKSFVVAAGVLEAIALYGHFAGWSNGVRDWKTLALIAVLLVLACPGVSLMLLWMYRDATVESPHPPRKEPTGLFKLLSRIHAYATRKSKNEPASRGGIIEGIHTLVSLLHSNSLPSARTCCCCSCAARQAVAMAAAGQDE